MSREASPAGGYRELPRWELLFAREPDAESDMEEMLGGQVEQERPMRSLLTKRSPAPKARKPSGPRPILIIVVLLLAVGVGYVMMDPGVLPPSVADLLGIKAPSEPVPPAGVPSPSMPQAAKPREAPPEPPPAPASPLSPPEQPSAPPQGPAQTPEASAPPTAQVKAAGPGPIPSPIYGEGQLVYIGLDPALAVGMIVLSGDASGVKPGPTVRPGEAVMVLDAEFQASGWIYSVRTPSGAVGWIAEKRLKAKP